MQSNLFTRLTSNAVLNSFISNSCNITDSARVVYSWAALGARNPLCHCALTCRGIWSDRSISKEIDFSQSTPEPSFVASNTTVGRDTAVFWCISTQILALRYDRPCIRRLSKVYLTGLTGRHGSPIQQPTAPSPASPRGAAQPILPERLSRPAEWIPEPAC